MRRWLTGLLVSGAVAGSAIVVASSWAPSGGGATTANLWIDRNAEADGSSCTRTSGAGAAYSTTAACTTLTAAYNAATTGDTVRIKSGTYPGELLKNNTDKVVIFEGESSKPSFGQLIMDWTHVTFRSIKVENRDRPTWDGALCTYWDFTFYLCGTDVTLDNIIIDGLNKGKAQGDDNRLGGLEITDTADRLTFKNSEIKGIRDNQAMKGGADDLLIENNEIHDMHLTTAGAAADVHLECVASTEGNRQVWRGNRFYDCATTDWQASNWAGGGAYGPVVFENNVFGCPILGDDPAVFQNGAPTLMIVGGNSGANQVTNWKVIGNTFECPGSIGTPSTGDDTNSAAWYNNLGWDPGCTSPEFNTHHNVGNVCSTDTGSHVVANALNTPSAMTQAPFYVNEAVGTYNFHPISGNFVDNGGDPTGINPTDRDGVTRANPPDIGAYEITG
jgi:hypothetical protein